MREKYQTVRVETAFLRSVVGFSLLDKKRSENIRTEMEVYNLNDKIQQSRDQ
jgi:hypothetical protein